MESRLVTKGNRTVRIPTGAFASRWRPAWTGVHLDRAIQGPLDVDAGPEDVCLQGRIAWHHDSPRNRSSSGGRDDWWSRRHHIRVVAGTSRRWVPSADGRPLARRVLRRRCHPSWFGALPAWTATPQAHKRCEGSMIAQVNDSLRLGRALEGTFNFHEDSRQRTPPSVRIMSLSPRSPPKPGLEARHLSP